MHCHLYLFVKAVVNRDTLLLMMFLGCANEWELKQMFCFHAALTGKQLLWTQNVLKEIKNNFLSGIQILYPNNCCAWQPGKHLCPQKCARDIASSFVTTFCKKEVKCY